ncbi:MAG TPA: hypothetical protein VHQ03_09435, partial [Candidatus Dormibacteraeota bacterium]|nr:hypothetical protein [Candidatus Dormibacteraeota bacterium]
MSRLSRAVVAVCAWGALAAPALAAQEFHPPPVRASGEEGTRLGLYGFGVRGGVDVAGLSQFVVGVTLDAGNLASNRLRLRPSGEIGVFNGVNSYVGSLEGVYRFTEDQEKVTPYVGAGLSLAGHDRCGADPQCPAVWANVLVGFELHYRSTFNWLLEYHA